MSEELLTLPQDLDSHTKEIIERSFLHTISEIGIHEIEYIKNKFEFKRSTLQAHKIEWVCNMVKYYEVLYKELYSENCLNGYEGNDVNVIAAALFYFINPYDVIPDFTKHVGFLDDYFVLSLCLKHLEHENREYLKKAFKEIV